MRWRDSGGIPDVRIIVLTTYSGDVQACALSRRAPRVTFLKNSLHKELLGAIRTVQPGEKNQTFRRTSLFKLAEHSAEESLSAAEVARPRLLAEGHTLRDSGAAPMTEDAVRGSQEHPLQVGTPRPHPRRDDRTQARDHRTLIHSKGC